VPNEQECKDLAAKVHGLLFSRGSEADDIWDRLVHVTKEAGQRALRAERVLEYVVQMHVSAYEDWRQVMEQPSPSKEAFPKLYVFANACKGTLQLVTDLQVVCNDVLGICKLLVPKTLTLTHGEHTDKYCLDGFDNEGRTIYKREDPRKARVAENMRKLRMGVQVAGALSNLKAARSQLEPGKAGEDDALSNPRAARSQLKPGKAGEDDVQPSRPVEFAAAPETDEEVTDFYAFHAFPAYRPGAVSEPVQTTPVPKHPNLTRASSSELRHEVRPLLSDNRFLCWSKSKRAWIVPTNRDGTADGKWLLRGALAVDAGTWEKVATNDELSVTPSVPPLISKIQVRELRDIDFRFGDPISEVCRIVRGTFAKEAELGEKIKSVLTALCSIARRLELGGHSVELASADPEDLLKTLNSISGLADKAVHAKLARSLPSYKDHDKKKNILDQLMIMNCRLLDLSDLHDVQASFLPRLLHRLCLLHWQRQHKNQALFLDIKASPPAHRLIEEPDRHQRERESHVRFVVVSDTHGWDYDLHLPEGDVLLHCGNLLFESGHVSSEREASLPAEENPAVAGCWGQLFAQPREVAKRKAFNNLEAVLELFSTEQYQKFQWIILVAGNHDQLLYDLWRDNEEKLRKMLPNRFVLLQAHTDFGDAGLLRSSGFAKDKDGKILDCVQTGAVWLYPKLNHGKLEIILRKPEGRSDNRGWVIAGTGVSLRSRAWSVNTAFQLDREHNTQLTPMAAKALTRYRPNIIISHGYPKAYEGEEVTDASGLQAAWDEGCGDEDLRRALDGCDSWKLVLFGHSREHHGVVLEREGRLFVNASLSTPLHVPARPPIVFDLTVKDLDTCGTKPSAADGGQCWEGVRGMLEALRASCHCAPRHLQLCNCALRCCWQEAEDLVEEWVPKDFIHKEVLELLENERDKTAALAVEQSPEVETKMQAARDGFKFSEFHVSGPAVLFSFQAIAAWGVNLLLTVLGLVSTGKPEAYVLQGAPPPECLAAHDGPRPQCSTFLPYPWWLWLVFLPVVFHSWHVQQKCLGYILLQQVQALGRGFTLLGWKCSFEFWRWVMFVWSTISLTDVTSQCLFYVQFLVSVHTNLQIVQVWRVAIQESWMTHLPMVGNITHFFTLLWSFMFLQAIYLVLHMFPTHNDGVDFGFCSMKAGYTTLASHTIYRFKVDYMDEEAAEDPGRLSWFDRCRRKCNKDKNQLFRYWHADILRTVAVYGRLATLFWEERALLDRRLKREEDQKAAVRFLQIMFNRLKDYVARILLIDIFEKGVKLEIQVSLLAIALALESDQSRRWSKATTQMLIAIALSFISVLYALLTHVSTLNFFWNKKYNPEHAHWLNKEANKKNWTTISRTLYCYAACIGILALTVLHFVMTFWKAFWCPFSLWNFNRCVQFNYKGTWTNRTLLLNGTPGILSGPDD